MAKAAAKDAKMLLGDMLKLGHGHDWTDEIRIKYAGLTRTETRAQLGKPDRELATPTNEPIDEYFVNTGFLDLRFTYDGSTKTWRLSHCHLG
jgi:hypothetical protein